MNTAQFWIESLQLSQHPEGGWFREVYRADESGREEHLPRRFSGDRSFSTAIYFLLSGDDFSTFHRIQQDELWHFYAGDPLTIHVIDLAGEYSTKVVGRDIHAGQELIVVVKAGCLFGAALENEGSFALVGCTVAPGFDFADLEMPSREALLRQHPRHRQVIEKLTR